MQYEKNELAPGNDKQVSQTNGASLSDLASNAASSASDAIPQRRSQRPRLNASGCAFDPEALTYKSSKRKTRGDEKLLCPYCKRSFRRPGYLRMHLVSHSDIGRDQFCDICSKGFVQKGHLMLHMRAHHRSFKRRRRNSCSISSSSSDYDSADSPSMEFGALLQLTRTPTTLPQQHLFLITEGALDRRPTWAPASSNSVEKLQQQQQLLGLVPMLRQNGYMQAALPDGPQKLNAAVPVSEDCIMDELLDLLDVTGAELGTPEPQLADRSPRTFSSVDDILVNYLGCLP